MDLINNVSDSQECKIAEQNIATFKDNFNDMFKGSVGNKQIEQFWANPSLEIRNYIPKNKADVYAGYFLNEKETL